MKHPTLSDPRLPIVLLLLFTLTGCSTASSLGLPVSSGSHRLMGAANARREAQGRPPAAPRELAKAVQLPHRIEPGDVLLIEPNDFNSTIRLPGDQTVLADGTIELGAYGTLLVSGMTVEDVEQNVQVLIATREAARRGPAIQQYAHAFPESVVPQPVGVDNSVSVRLVRQESTVFYVLGEVSAPGSYPLVGHETVLDAIIAAGGVTTLANEHKIILSRPAACGQGRTVLPVCYQSIVQLGETAANYQIYPGDRIYVPSLSLLEDIRQSLHIRASDGCPHCEAHQ